MSTCNRRVRGFVSALMLAVLGVGSGCQTLSSRQPLPPMGATAPARVPAQNVMPRELCKVVLPAYVIEPPDMLMIDAIHAVPRPPYHLRALDTLSIQVLGTLPDVPIAGVYGVEPGGWVRLGLRYDSVQVGGMTVQEAEAAITKHLERYLKEPIVSVTLTGTAATQQIAGPHLVAPDGTVTLGIYGSVPVVGMTIADARSAIEQFLSQYLDNPQISVDVAGYNSKVYYIVTQGAGMGDGVYRFPITGNETVLDAISQINGLNQVASKRIWIARPTDEPGKVQILPVKWEDITAQAMAGTNYQVLPGDRLFIAEDKLVAFDTGLAKLTAPLERIMGFSLLGVGAATRFSGSVLHGGGNPQGNF